MINAKQDPKCADIVQDKFNDTEADYRSAREFFEDYDQQTEGGKIALEVLAKDQGTYYHEYDDMFDYINQTALSWDYVDSEGRAGRILSIAAILGRTELTSSESM